MLQTSFLNIQFKNPLVLASGILGLTAASMKRSIDLGAGGVTVKSISKEPRTGHPNPTMFGTDHFFMNAVGLSNPGIDASIEELKKYKQIDDAPLIGSIFAGTITEFDEMAERINEAPIDLLEVDVSCPNVNKEFGKPFAYDGETLGKITALVKKNSRVPIILKLSPNAWNIAELARIAEANGADALTCVNTVSAMKIDIQARKPILHNRTGGLSGPALLPIAIKCVYDVYAAVTIPIIGTGGVTSGADALEMIMAGATLVGLGTAIYYRGQNVFQKIIDEMQEFLKKENIPSLHAIRGCAHT